MRGLVFALVITFAPQLSRAETFFCTGRAGPFQLDFADDALIVSGLNEKKCVLPQDKSFKSEDRYFFQVQGAYDNGPKEVAELDLPELVSPEGYLSYGNEPGVPVDPACVEFFEKRKLRNFYIQKQMVGDNPDNYEETVINVFKTPQGWPMLYLNFCVKKSSGGLI